MDFLILLLGIICAAIGGELFVRGVVGIALWARISSGIIAATFAAFATSSPELSVSVTSALAGTPQIALGDALGSNVVNIALILGIALLIAPLKTPKDVLKRDFPVALLVPILLIILAQDGLLSRADGLILLSLFAIWVVIMVLEVRRQRSVAPAILGDNKHGRSVIESLIGLAFLVGSGKLIVSGATAISAYYGIDPFLVGATLVAMGTSAPELATVVISRLRGHDEVGLGTILGSNIFNGLFVVAIAAIINPIAVKWGDVSTGLIFGLITSICLFPLSAGLIERRRGALLLALYAVYISVLLQRM
ncbi:cation:H+ antiporter [Novimethylophilus kurashikiensis]|uniref:Cation:H+ antiporter n=1 Tax=Novimethylophilus kurashikiensis TaxID=1825523 RepID=A0A2R5F7Q8_9PROT|nr:sodium:calcium antiporter [Novimethylophilus kurashikiensis]GBG14227.1 cation:H+ antiporter [Novimethylophilus kurashikiensis]